MGFAAVFPDTTRGGRLTREASISTAELYAINAVVHEILKGTIDGNRFTIFSDSRSALLALRSDFFFFFFFMNGNTERAQCALSLVCIPKEMEKSKTSL